MKERTDEWNKLIFEDYICPFCGSPLKHETWKEKATMNDETYKEFVAKTKKETQELAKFLDGFFPHTDAYASYTCPKCGTIAWMHATVLPMHACMVY